MKCPKCSGIKLNIAERDGVEIDYCPECRGVWLDRGELDKIIVRSDGLIPTNLQPQPLQQQTSHNQRQFGKSHRDGHVNGLNGSHKKKLLISECLISNVIASGNKRMFLP
jgi:Zn-finger nucleic acid-binding protein